MAWKSKQSGLYSRPLATRIVFFANAVLPIIIPYIYIVKSELETGQINFQGIPFFIGLLWTFFKGAWKFLCVIIPEGVPSFREIDRQIKSIICWMISSLLILILTCYFKFGFAL